MSTQGENMQVFSFRAECPADVKAFQAGAAQANLPVAIRQLTVEREAFNDTEVEFQSTATLDELRNVMREVIDGHVMAETLRGVPLADNSLERTYLR
jgi:hypothetical protein